MDADRHGTLTTMSPATLRCTGRPTMPPSSFPQAEDFVQQLQHTMRRTRRAGSYPATQYRRRDPRESQGMDQALPLGPQPDPPNLLALKAEIARQWPMTSLLDVLKETDVRVGFTQGSESHRLGKSGSRDPPIPSALDVVWAGTGAGSSACIWGTRRSRTKISSTSSNGSSPATRYARRSPRS